MESTARNPNSELVKPEKLSRFTGRSFFSGLNLSIRYISSELIRSPASYLWSLSTVAITVFVIAIVIAATTRSAIIFLRISEILVGEQDIVLTPGAGIVTNRILYPSPLPLLNSTQIDMALAGRGSQYQPSYGSFAGLYTYLNHPYAYDDGEAFNDYHPYKLPVKFSKSGFGPSASATYTDFYNAHIAMNVPATPAATHLAGAASRHILYGSVANATMYVPITPPATTPGTASLVCDEEQLAQMMDRVSMLGGDDALIDDTSSPYSTPTHHPLLLGTTTANSIVAGIDTSREQFINLGRVFAEKHGPVPANSVLAGETVLRSLGLKDSDIARLQAHTAERERALATGTARGSGGAILSRNTYYKAYNVTSRSWEGPGVMPLIAVRYKLDYVQSLVALGVVKASWVQSTGSGTAADPFVTSSPLTGQQISNIIESTGVSPPHGFESWESYMASPAVDLLGPPSTWLNWTTVSEALDEQLPKNVTTVQIDSTVSQVFDAWRNATIPDSDTSDSSFETSTKLWIQGQAYNIAQSLLDLVPNSDGLIELNFGVNDLTGKREIDQEQMDASFAAALNSTYSDNVTGTTKGDWAEAFIGMFLNNQLSTPIAVAGVIESGEGKFSDTLGNIIIRESNDIFSSVQNDIYTLDADYNMYIPFDVSKFFDEAGFTILGYPISIPGATAELGPINLNPSKLSGIEPRVAQAFLTSFYPREAVPAVFAMIGSGGAERIGEAYDEAYVRPYNSAYKAYTRESYNHNDLKFYPVPHHAAAAQPSIATLQNPHSDSNITTNIAYSTAYSTDSAHSVAANTHYLPTPPVDYPRASVPSCSSAIECVYDSLYYRLSQFVGLFTTPPSATIPLTPTTPALQTQSKRQASSSAINAPLFTSTPSSSPQLDSVSSLSPPSPSGTDRGLRYRQEVYMSSEGGMDRAFSRLTSMMFNSLGPAFPATASLPLLETMRSSLTMRFFLEAIFLAVIFMVLLIASITVYSLFNIDTETNTYTYAMLRALGLTRPQLATMLVLKALTIGILGTAVGLTVATFAIMFVDELLRRSTNAAATDIFTSASLGISIAVGIALPLGATILPIGRAMSTVLVNALTASRSAANQAASTIQELSKLDMQPYQVTAALLLIVFGVFTAYLMPMALLNEDMQLFLGLLVTVLMCTLVGLSLLSQSIMPRLHTAMGWIFTIRQNASRSLLLKALPAHRPSNAKLSLLYTITLSFVVFSGSVFGLLDNAMANSIRISMGAPLVLTAKNPYVAALPTAAISGYLEPLKTLPPTHDLYGVVKGHSFITSPISGTKPGKFTFDVHVSPLSKAPRKLQFVYGLQKNFTKSVYMNLYQDIYTNKVSSESATGIDDMLYHPIDTSPSAVPSHVTVNPKWRSGIRGGVNGVYASVEAEKAKNQTDVYTSAVPCVMSDALRGTLTIDVDTPVSISLHGFDHNEGINPSFLGRLRSSAGHVPGFSFSAYKSFTDSGSLLMSDENVAKLINQPMKNITYERAMIMLSPTITAVQRATVIDGVASAAAHALGKSDSIEVTDTEGMVESVAFAAETLSWVFTALSGVVMVLCFATTLVTVSTNTTRQAPELAILRALGLCRWCVVWLVVLETLVVAVSALVAGTGIGLTIAIALTMIFNMMANLPFQMVFPYEMYGVVVAMVVIASGGAAMLPGVRITSARLANSLKKL